MPLAPSPTSPRLETPRPELDRAVAALQERKGAWAAVGVRERIDLLKRLRRDFLGVSDRWAAAGIAAEGIDPESPAAAEETLAGPYLVLRNLRLLQQSLEDIAETGRPRIPGPVRTLPNGQVAAQVFPMDLYDRLFYSGVTAEIWMQPGVTPGNLHETMAVSYQAGADRSGAVALVLGGGNASSIGPMDALYKLFVENQVVLLKAHPVNAYLGPLLEEGFQALGRRGYFQIVYGGAEEGAYLCRHPGVDEIHITGSDRTYDAIVFGTGEEGRRNKAERRRILTKRVTAELGNVSPVIVMPGPAGSWTDADIAFQAENLVSMLVNNAGFNCNAARVVVQSARWPERARLDAAVRALLAKVPPRQAYYPGAADRYDAFLAAHPQAHQVGTRQGTQLPWAWLPELDPTRKDDIAFTTEAFCGVFGEAGIDGSDPVDFLERAVAFANDTLWGTLNATLIVHPATMKDPVTAKAVEKAIADLRYGTVSLNHWAAVGYGLGVTPWGAFPGHEPHDIRSGVGVVHNTLMFDRIEKGVVRSPFRTFPKPAWFATHKTAHRLVPKLTRFETAPSVAKLPGIFALALRG